jgi:hypothetical protein
MNDFEKALRKVQQRQMTHGDRAPTDEKVRQALKSMEQFVVPQSPAEAAMMFAGGPIGGKLFKGAALTAGAMTSDDAEAALNPKYILKELIERVKGVPDWKSRSKSIEMTPDDFLALSHPLNEVDIKRVNDLVESFKQNQLQNQLQLWFEHNGKGVANIVGHEGRHRAMAAKKLGLDGVPVELRGDIRWSEQTDPSRFDYVEEWPQKLISEGNDLRVQFPIPRETTRLYHGGRSFDKWDPSTVGTGEGYLLPQGPGLYLGNRDLAKVYKKYGGDDPALLQLDLDTSRVLDPAVKMSPSEREAYEYVSKKYDPRGYGLRNKLSDLPKYRFDEVRKDLIDSGIDGFKQYLNDDFGYEWSIFNPDIIKSIERIE